ncbi:RpiB/LacA/LacB family sugar-phosphate isomerase [Candidatus Woesearchaeota archaeon]|nr:RpiB/LacA/LacB family sugar-phosphate isomerase [Candidatus Woesearchaeota archaeon]
MKTYLGADHAGFWLKEKLKKSIKGLIDMSPEYDEKDDYPIISAKLAKKVAKEKTKGILVCGSGAGVAIAANKIKGIRAVPAFDTYEATMSRQHNDANIICLRARKFPAKKAIMLAKLWLKTQFSKEERHVRRIKQIRELEN